jgi:hypothetical protein
MLVSLVTELPIFFLNVTCDPLRYKIKPGALDNCNAMESALLTQLLWASKSSVFSSADHVYMASWANQIAILWCLPVTPSFHLSYLGSTFYNREPSQDLLGSRWQPSSETKNQCHLTAPKRFGVEPLAWSVAVWTTSTPRSWNGASKRFGMVPLAWSVAVWTTNTPKSWNATSKRFGVVPLAWSVAVWITNTPRSWNVASKRFGVVPLAWSVAVWTPKSWNSEYIYSIVLPPPCRCRPICELFTRICTTLSQ